MYKANFSKIYLQNTSIEHAGDGNGFKQMTITQIAKS